MSTLSFKLDQLFTLLVPDLVVDVVVGTFKFPDEIEFVQKFLSAWSHFVLRVTLPLPANPLP
jgi:hypothetical protein